VKDYGEQCIGLERTGGDMSDRLAKSRPWIAAMRHPKKFWQYLRYIFKYPHLFKVSEKVEGLISFVLGVFLYECVLNSPSSSPNVVDVGSYKGLSTCYLSLAAVQVGKRIKSFELFSGLPMCDPCLDRGFYKGQFASTISDFESQAETYGCREVIDLVVGDARQTMLPALGDEGFSVAFLDMDVYEVTREVLLQLWSIAKGNETILIHDVNSLGVRKAIDEFHTLSNNRVPETILFKGTVSRLDIPPLSMK